MKFFRTTALASISTASTIITGLISTKYVAVLIGPSGMALTGQFYNLSGVVILLASAAVPVGVVKLLAEHPAQEKRRQIVQTVYTVTGLASLALSVSTVIFSSFLSQKLFLNRDFIQVFWVFGGLLFFQIQTLLFSAILNGTGRIKAMTIFTVSTSVLNLLIVVVLVRAYGVRGVLVSTGVANFLIWIASLRYMRKTGFAGTGLDYRINKEYAKQLLNFSTMSLVTGLLIPAMQFSIRSKLIYQISIRDAGIWQATLRMSDYYLNFIYSVLSIYYLPKLSSINDAHELRKEILLGYARILPAVIAITILIWLLRYFIIHVFLSNEFVDMVALLRLYLIGDVFKIASWILAFLMWARALKKVYIVTEILFALLSILINFWFINLYGVVGTGWAYITLYLFYLLLMVSLLGHYITKPKAA